MITIEKLDEWKACGRRDSGMYSDEKLAIIFNGRQSLTPLEVLHLDIRMVDRLWVVLRRDVVGVEICARHRGVCADRVVEKYALCCGERNIEQWAKEWLSGVDRSMERLFLMMGLERVMTNSVIKLAIDVAMFSISSEKRSSWDTTVVARSVEWAAARENTIYAREAVEAEGQWQLDRLIEMLR